MNIRQNLTKVALVASSISLQVLPSVGAESESIIVTASRLPELQTQTSSTVELIEASNRERRQQPRIQDALNMAPGVISTSTAGQEGQIGTLIIRGLKTQYNQVMMDGVRISDAANNSNYGNILGNFAMGGHEQIEVAKAGQNVVHGNATTGGLVGIYERFSDQAPQHTIAQEVGSYEYTRSQISSKGTVGDLSYYLNLNSENYEQDLPSERAFQVANKHASLGLQYSLSEEYAVKLTARTQQSDLENSATPQTIGTDFQLYSLQFLTNIEDFYKSALVFGYFGQEYNMDKGGFFPEMVRTDYEKWSATFDNTFQLSNIFALNAGLDVSLNSYKDFNTYTLSRPSSWESYAGYLGVNATLENTVFNASARIEDRTDYGVLPAYEASVRHTIAPLNMQVFLRGSYGVSVPTLLQTNAFAGLFGNQLANPDLSEEVVRSIELGLQYELNPTNTLGVTAYSSFIKNAIVNSYAPDYSNQFDNVGGTSEIYGLESYVRGQISGNLHYGLSWNYTMRNEALNIPRNTLNADFSYVTDRWTVGVGIEHRTKATYGSPVPTDSYVTTRLYGQCELTDHLTLSARVENLFDEEYIVNPFPYSEEEGRLARGVFTNIGLKYEW